MRVAVATCGRFWLLFALLCWFTATGATFPPGHAPRARVAQSSAMARLLQHQRQLRNQSETPPSGASSKESGRLAVVYLVPRHHNSSTHRKGQDSLANLHNSLEQLFENVMSWQEPRRVDVLLFHTGDFTTADLDQLKTRARQGIIKSAGPHKEHVLQRLDSDGTDGMLQLLRLHRQHWRVPPFLHMSDIEGWQHPAASAYTEGYFNMLRFFGTLVFRITSGLGYSYVMRLDDDSFIKSPVEYDLANFMESNGYDYGYRVTQTEGASFTRGFPEALRLYITMFDVKPTFLYEHCTPQSLEGLAGGGWDSYAYYNNFFIARNAMFTNATTAHFLAYIDRLGGIYTQRWGDALIHAAAVQMFTPKERVHGFADWKYKHNWLEAPKGKRAHWGTTVKYEDA